MAVVYFTTYFVNLTEPLAHIESHILAKFIPVLTKLCMKSLKFQTFSVRRHLFRYGGLYLVIRNAAINILS